MAGNNGIVSFDDISTGVSYENYPKDPAAREAIAIVNNKVEELKDKTVGRQDVINLENKVKQSGLDNENFKEQVNQKLTNVKNIVDGIDGGNTAKIEELETAVNDKAPRDLVDSLLGQIEGSVKQINGLAPDEDGNVIIDLNTTGLATSEEVARKTDEIANLVFNKAETSVVEKIADDVADLSTQVGLKASEEEFTTKTEALTSQLAEKATELSSLVTMKSYDAKLGEVITTNGYYISGDKGGGKYLVVNTGVTDEGLIVALDNGLKAKLIHGGTIYARQYGVKLDDVTDDTVRLNAFFKKFGYAKLVVNDGICVTSSPLIVKGRWREDSPVLYDNSIRKLIFDQASIRYTGPIDKCCIMFWHHFTSFIEGLAIARTSNKCYVDMSMVWHTEFKNFDVKDVCINRDTSIVSETIETKACHTNVFNRGYILGDLSLTSTGTYVNSIHFEHVNIFSTGKEYSVKFYGTTSFQNITFTRCDISYATKSIFYIDSEVEKSCAITLDTCYLDSSIPYTENYRFKGFKLINTGTTEAAGNSKTTDLLYMENFMESYRTGVFGGASVDSTPTANANLCKNGDFTCTNTAVSPGWIANVAGLSFAFKKTDSSLGNTMVATFSSNLTTYFYGVPAPFKGSYVAGLRLKKISGTGTIQIGFGNPVTYRLIDLSTIAANEEFILTSPGKNTRYDAGSSLAFSLSVSGKGVDNVVFEISEAFIIPGMQIRIMLPLHPNAKVFQENKGVTVFNGTGAITSKIIPHGLYAIPSEYTVDCVSLDAGEAGIKYITSDATNITVYFKTAPIAGTSNVSLKWKAKL